MTPALRALQRRCRTVTYTLCGDIGSGMRLDPALGFDNYIRQLDAVLRANGPRAGGALRRLVRRVHRAALRGAAARSASRALILVVGARRRAGRRRERQRRYLARPWLSAPKFVLTSPPRMWPEIQAAYDTWPQRLMFSARPRRARALRADVSAVRWRRGCRLAAEPRLRPRLRARQGADARRDRRGRARSRRPRRRHAALPDADRRRRST